MFHINSPPKEGDIYKIIKVGDHVFELRFGYYADFERAYGEPVVVYPDLTQKHIYTNEGDRIVTAVQDSCRYYEALAQKEREDCCRDCIYFSASDDDIGICKCMQNSKKQ